MNEPAQLWSVIVIPGVVMAVGLLIAFLRKGSVASTRMGTRRIEVVSAMDPAAVFARLTRITGDLKVDDASPDAKIVILSSSPSLVTWGFLYPVIIHAAGTGSRIEVGVLSKVLQWGPLVTRAHKKCVAAIEDAIGIPAARVAQS
jgi:hypothetical protein